MSTASYSAPTRPRTSRTRSHRWQPRAWKSVIFLGVEATRDRGFRDAMDGEAVGGEPHRDGPFCLRRPRLLEGARDDLVQPCVDLVLLPEVLLEALHPLEVRDDDAAGIREHVREHEHAVLLEDRVGGRRHRPVRALDDELRTDLVRVLLGDDLL